MKLEYNGMRRDHQVKAQIEPNVLRIMVEAGTKRRTKADVLIDVTELEDLLRQAKAKGAEEAR